MQVDKEEFDKATKLVTRTLMKQVAKQVESINNLTMDDGVKAEYLLNWLINLLGRVSISSISGMILGLMGEEDNAAKQRIVEELALSLSKVLEHNVDAIFHIAADNDTAAH